MAILPRQGHTEKTLRRTPTTLRRTTKVAARPTRDDNPTALWASAQVTARLGDNATPPPRYGTTEWQQLPDASPQKVAAIITAAEMWRKYGDEDALLAWFQETRQPHAPLATRKTTAELDALAQPKPPRPVHATDGWPPIAIPGRPGWHRHLTAGQQVDLQKNTQESAA